MLLFRLPKLFTDRFAPNFWCCTEMGGVLMTFNCCSLPLPPVRPTFLLLVDSCLLMAELAAAAAAAAAAEFVAISVSEFRFLDKQATKCWPGACSISSMAATSLFSYLLGFKAAKAEVAESAWCSLLLPVLFKDWRSTSRMG